MAAEPQIHAQKGEILNIVPYVQLVKLIWGGSLLVKREKIFLLI